MEIRNIISFIKVAEQHSFSKAAHELGYTQSNVTMQIKQLEHELNTILFDRIGKTISLTEDGKSFMKYALTITCAISDAKQELADVSTVAGELKIGLLDSLCITYLPQIMKEFHQNYPLVNIVIKIGTYEELSSMLNSNRIDLLWTFDYQIESLDWIKEYEYTNSIKVIAPLTHALAHKNDIALSSLACQTFIFTESNCSYRKAFENLLLAANIPFSTFMEIGNTEIIKKFVASGICLSVLPEFSVKNELQANEFISLDVSDFHFDMFGQIFYHKNKWLTPAMKEFGLLIKKYTKK